MKPVRRLTVLAAAAAATISVSLGALAVLVPAEATDGLDPAPSSCRGMARLVVPGAERLEATCLADLTTTGTVSTGHTDPSPLTGFGGLNAVGTVNPSGVPGIQLDGYFPDTSTFNTTHGWNHDAQFVIRLPRHWNGGLVVAGPPGVRRQYASDVIISDTVLARGYAYASTDKGNNGPTLYTDGQQPGDIIGEWHSRVTELTIAAKEVLAQNYHRKPRTTYIAGFSVAGYLARWQLENRPDLYDGGIAWSGVLITPERNLLTVLPTTLRNYPTFAATGSPAAQQAILNAGIPAGSEPTWEYSYRAFWDPIQRLLREELDPTYDGDTQAGHPFCASGSPDCEADYALNARPQEVRDAIRRVSLNGRIGKPLLQIQGTLDTAVTPADTRHYSAMVANEGRGGMTRLYEIAGGSHFEGRYSLYPDLLRPTLPCFREAFPLLERWTKNGDLPPANHVVTRDSSVDLLNTCSLSTKR